MPTLLDLPRLMAALPADLHPIAHVFAVDIATGWLTPPPEMDQWIIGHFGSVEAVREQTIIKIHNRLTLEGALFNQLRARRPSGSVGDDAALAEWVASELADDIFAAPLRDTPADIFGRMKGRFCVTASNIAKYDAWHGLVIPHEPDPLRFDAEHIGDYLTTALRWIVAAHAHDPAARFPLITWNCLPKSGATIVHAHWQIALSRDHPYARVELWRRAAQSYRAETGRDYAADLLAFHRELGLGLELPGIAACVHLTPARNREIVLMTDARLWPPDADTMPDGTATYLVADGLAGVLRGLIDGMQTRAFNMAIALPPKLPEPGWEGFPTIIRIGDRGPALTTRNDVGAMEFYGTGVIAEDPFGVAERLRFCMTR